MAKEACEHAVFVYDSTGNNLFHGTFQKPLKAIQSALSQARSLCAVRSSDGTLCITIRGGTYCLSTNATTTSSQIGVIAVSSDASNLVIENYQDERVILIGGTLF